MARITLRQLLDHAAERGYGVPAFNINNMEQGLAIMEAASAVDAPVIIQASRGARSYANDIMLSKMIEALEKVKVDCKLVTIEGAAHGFNQKQNEKTVAPEMLAWFDKYLAKKKE